MKKTMQILYTYRGADSVGASGSEHPRRLPSTHGDIRAEALGCIDNNSSYASPVCRLCVFVKESVCVCVCVRVFIAAAAVWDECAPVNLATSHASTTVSTHQQKHKSAPLYTYTNLDAVYGQKIPDGYNSLVESASTFNSVQVQSPSDNKKKYTRTLSLLLPLIVLD